MRRSVLRDNAAQAQTGEECDGVDDGACPGRCNPPGHPDECECLPPPVCGDDARESNEQCDGTDDSDCPGLCQGDCTCGHVCGDGMVTGIEECDGDDDSACPTQCLAAGDPMECTCPPQFCGNNFVDVSLNEECDGTATPELGAFCDPSDCRPPDDPTGECTCTCGGEPLPPAPRMPDPDQWGSQVEKNRYIAMVVPESAGQQVAVRVRLTSLHHPEAPEVVPDFGPCTDACPGEAACP